MMREVGQPEQVITPEQLDAIKTQLRFETESIRDEIRSNIDRYPQALEVDSGPGQTSEELMRRIERINHNIEDMNADNFSSEKPALQGDIDRLRRDVSKIFRPYIKVKQP